MNDIAGDLVEGKFYMLVRLYFAETF